MFAVVRTGGKQYRVQEGRRVRVERLPGELGATIELGDVLMIGDGADVTIGAPTVAGARVLGTIEEQGRAKKIIVFKYKSKTRARKKTGHRQQFTTVVVDDILAAGQQPKPKVEKPTAAAPEAEAAPKTRGRRSKAAAAEAEAPVAEAPEAMTAEAPESSAPETTAESPDAAVAEEAPEATVAEEAPPEKPKRGRKKAG